MTEYRYTTRRPPDKMVHKFFFNIHLKRKEIQQKMLNFKLYLSMVFKTKRRGGRFKIKLYDVLYPTREKKGFINRCTFINPYNGLLFYSFYYSVCTFGCWK
jgi:hypothetical protein